MIVAAIGIFTAILAASIAFTQTDIKRVLAYSTLSQLGYMFAALGVGAFIAAIFHLMTHGFFKGLLFLGSGSVIHAVHEEQDMNRMGGLWRKIPITHWTMLIGAIAIAGIPPLAGFFSKDEILADAYKVGDYWVWIIGLTVAVMTAFYMWRLMGKTFYGPSHVDPAVEPKIHESPPSMTIPLILLAIPSVLLGIFLTWGGPPLWPDGTGLLEGWLEPVFAASEAYLHETPAGFELAGIDGALIIISVAAAALGLSLGIWLFGFFRNGGRPRAGRAADGRQPRHPVPVPRLAQQVVVRRPQPPAVHRHRRAGRGRAVVVRPGRHRRHGQRDRRGDPQRGRRAAAGSRPAGSRTTRWASRSACSSWPARSS